MEAKDQDRELLCQDCQSPFTWTAGEQRFYREQGFTQPKRCPGCRAYLTAENQRAGASQGGAAWIT